MTENRLTEASKVIAAVSFVILYPQANVIACRNGQIVACPRRNGALIFSAKTGIARVVANGTRIFATDVAANGCIAAIDAHLTRIAGASKGAVATAVSNGTCIGFTCLHPQTTIPTRHKVCLLNTING